MEEFEKIEAGSHKLKLFAQIQPKMEAFFGEKIQHFSKLPLPSEKSVSILLPILFEGKTPDFSALQQLGMREAISLYSHRGELMEFFAQAASCTVPLGILSQLYRGVEGGKVTYYEAASSKITLSLKSREELEKALDQHSHIFTTEQRSAILNKAENMTSEEAGK